MPATVLRNLISGDRVQSVLVREVNKADFQFETPPILPAKSDPVSHFYSTVIPLIRPTEYALRLNKYAQCSDSVFLHALVLLRRMAKKDRRLVLNPLNVHRLLITAVMISAKFLDHAWYSSSFYAQVGGIPSVQEMNALEVAMLKLLDHRVFVSPDELIRIAREPKNVGSEKKYY